jgi:LacI family repressor for deo operon, udp, cdd, tsx, nupC, and nupG
VLSAPGRVSEATRERVHQAVKETGYTINQAARSLRQRTSRALLLVVPDLGNAFYSTIVDAVIREAAVSNYSVTVATSVADDPNRWLGDYLLSSRADGMLLFDGSLETNRLHGLDGEGTLPLVAAYDEIPDEKINSVITDNRLAAMRAVRHLVELGHRDIGHIIGPSRNANRNERHLGFLAAMAEAGLPAREEWIYQGDYRVTSAEAAAEYFLTAAKLPTAVFAANDEMALGLIHRLRQSGIDCPRDISVIGFDDVPMSPYMTPPLTTMRQPRQQIGEVATRALINIIEGNSLADAPVHIVLKAELVVRESTRRIG